MTITCLGAAREVTGSCYLLSTGRTRILIDCGLFQGGHFCETRNHEPWPFDPATIDAAVITHAHLDHTGRLPLLAKGGFRGKIFLTPPTRDLTRLVLQDALTIMREEFERHARPVLYEDKDFQTVERLFKPTEYETTFQIGDLTVRLREAGHIFGSAFVEIEERGGAQVVFSGDLGNEHVPILRPTSPLAPADAVFIESTYGNRLHEDESSRTLKLLDAVAHTIARQGVLLIPAFAIERTQQLLYELNGLVEQKRLPRIDVYLDSPMAIETSKIIEAYPQYYNAETFGHVSRGETIFEFPGLHLTPTRDDSKLINQAPKPKVIIAGAGMMNGGRILHHLARYLGSPDTTVMIVGYQSHATLGHALYSGQKQVEVLGERIQVKADIISIGAYSAHADERALEAWIGSAPVHPKQVWCTHGDEDACLALAERLHAAFGVEAEAPHLGQTIVLA